jgi:hypothetical protein
MFSSYRSVTSVRLISVEDSRAGASTTGARSSPVRLGP